MPKAKAKDGKPTADLLQYTEADIIARRHELEVAREEIHKKQVEELEKKLKELEAKRRDLEHRGRQDLHKLTLIRQDLEEKLQACFEQQQQCLRDVKASQEAEIQRYDQELEDLQATLAGERAEYEKKQEHVIELEDLSTKHEEATMKEVEILQQLLADERDKLDAMAKEHEEKRKEYVLATEKKMHAFEEENEHLTEKIDGIKRDIDQKKREQKKVEADDQRRRDELSKIVANEKAERDVKLAPLFKEKGMLKLKIQKMQSKIEEAKNKEEANTDEILRQYEDAYHANQRSMDQEREDMEKMISDKEIMVVEKETELAKMKAEHDQKLQEAEADILRQIRELDEEIKREQENNREEIGREMRISKEQEGEEALFESFRAHQNRHAGNQAEVALVKFSLDAILDKEKHLREELAVKQDQHTDTLNELEAELIRVRQNVDREQSKCNQMQQERDQRQQEKRTEFEAQVRQAQSNLSDLNNRIATLQLGLKLKEEHVRDRGEHSEFARMKIRDGVKRLEDMRDELKQQIGPLEKKRETMKQKLIQDLERHKEELEVLMNEEHVQTKEHENETCKLHCLLDSQREQFGEERQAMQQALKDILDANEKLRAKHEQELLDMNTKLVETLQASGGQPGQVEAAQRLLHRISELQKEAAAKSRALEDNAIKHDNEKSELRINHDQAVRGLIKTPIKRGSEKAEEPGSELQQQADEKESKYGSDKKSQLQKKIQEEKSKHEELQKTLSEKKSELSALMNNGQEEPKEEAKGESEQKRSHLPDGTLRERLDHLSELRSQIQKEETEKEKLHQEIARLKVEKITDLECLKLDEEAPISFILKSLEKKEQDLRALNQSNQINVEAEDHKIVSVKQQLESMRKTHLPATHVEKQEQVQEVRSGDADGVQKITMERKSAILGTLSTAQGEPAMKIVSRGFDKEVSVGPAPKVHPIRPVDENSTAASSDPAN